MLSLFLCLNFFSLSCSDKNSDKNFEKVTRGGPSMPNPGSQGPRLDLENRFAALGQNWTESFPESK